MVSLLRDTASNIRPRRANTPLPRDIIPLPANILLSKAGTASLRKDNILPLNRAVILHPSSLPTEVVTNSRPPNPMARRHRANTAPLPNNPMDRLPLHSSTASTALPLLSRAMERRPRSSTARPRQDLRLRPLPATARLRSYNGILTQMLSF